MNYENDIFDYLGINGREDSYTNLLKALFDNVPKYKTDLLKLLFNKDDLNINDFYFETRRKYSRCDKDTKNHEEIPDAIIVDKTGDYFALIEVKVFAGEGEEQTQRYFNMFNENNIKVACECGDVELREQTNRKFYFLTIFGDKPTCKEFISLKWEDVVEPLQSIKISNSYLSELAKSLINKINSTKIVDVENISDALMWIDTMGYGWANERNMFEILKHYCFNSEKWNETDKWNGYNKDSNACELKCSFGKERWIGKHIRDLMYNNNVRDCFQFHYEIAFNPATDNLLVRLDYHLNPYLSKSDINKIMNKNNYIHKHKYYGLIDVDDDNLPLIAKVLIDANKNERKNIARSLKAQLVENLRVSFDEKFTTNTPNNPMVLVKYNIDTTGKNIKDVTDLVNKFIECTENVIDDFVKQI